jgi:hypothetical protein
MLRMADEPVIAGLLAKRTELEEAIADLEYQVRQRRTQLAQLDATLGLFAPGLTQARRRLSVFVRSAHFASGELTGRCQDALREADGEYVTVETIVWRAMQDKGLDLADADVRDDFARRFTWTLTTMLSRGAVRKVGNGATARWGLVEP